MPSLNRLTIMGHLGRDPELRFTQSGAAVTSFSVAVTRAWPDQSQASGWAEETTWFDVSVWREQAERVAEKIHKGDLVIVEGRVKVRAYTTKDGRSGASLDVDASKVIGLGRREKLDDEQGEYAPPRADSQITDEQLVAATGGGTVTNAPKPESPGVDIDDIPF